MLIAWRPLIGCLVAGLALLVQLVRASGPTSEDGLYATSAAPDAPATTASSWDDDLFTEISPSSTSIHAVDILRPNDLHVFGDGLLGGDGWNDDFSSNCGAGSSYPSFD